MTEITETIKELTLSLGLIQLLSDIKPIEPQEKIVEYLQTTGIYFLTKRSMSNVKRRRERKSFTLNMFTIALFAI